jgi:hypothetical protein
MQAIDHSKVLKSTYRNQKTKTKQNPLTIAPTTKRRKTKHRRSSSSWKAGKLHNSQQQGEQEKANAKARRAAGSR